MRNRLEVVFETEEEIDPERIRLALESMGLQYKTLRRVDIEKVVNGVKKKGCCGGDNHKSPSLMQKGLNLVKATTEHIITGMKHVPPSVYLQRLEKCRECEFKQEGFVCSKCGCYMGIKASWLEQKCIENKW